MFYFYYKHIRQTTAQTMSSTTKKYAETKEKILIQTLELTTELGWEFITLRDIAERADISLADLHTYYEDKMDILCAFGRMIDRKVLAEIETPDPESSHRDLLFDILMERFDAINEHRAAVISIYNAFRFEPKQALTSMPHLCRSMTWMLEAAGIDTNGFKGAARVAGLTGVYLKTVRIWVKDDSADMGKTMAALDKSLGGAEKFAGMIGL